MRCWSGSSLKHFRLSASGDELTDYHLEAEIAAVHAFSPDFASTDWERILQCYDDLQKRNFSPIVELNRVVALEKLHGVDAAQSALDDLGADALPRPDLFHITRAHLFGLRGEHADAIAEIETAITFATNQPIRRFLQLKIEKLRACHCPTLT